MFEEQGIRSIPTIGIYEIRSPFRSYDDVVASLGIKESYLVNPQGRDGVAVGGSIEDINIVNVGLTEISGS